VTKRAFLHLGLPKTATTYLQTILWGQRDAVAAQGLLLPGRERRDHLWVSRVVREEPERKRRPEREHEAMARVLSDVAAWDGDVLVSHEFFAAASAAQAQAFVEQLAATGREVHVVLTAREPLGLFTASWQESLKNRSTTALRDYGRSESQSPQDIWDWRTLDLSLVLERWLEAVPADRTHVLPLDRSADREEIWRRFAGVVGLDPTAVDVSGSFPNESMGVVEAELLRRVNAHLGEFRSAFDRGVWIRTYLADERLVTRGGERFWPYPDQVEDCRARGERAVALLADRCVDLVGDPAWLRVPETLEQRRTPETVSDTEVADAAAEVIAGLLGDVRATKAERGAGAGDRPAGRRSLLSRLRGRRSPSR
jgi:hypothetical protein